MSLGFAEALMQMKMVPRAEKTRQKYLHYWRDAFEGKNVLIEEEELDHPSMVIALAMLRAMQGHQVQFFACNHNAVQHIQHIMNNLALEVGVHFSMLKVRVPGLSTDCDADTVVYYGLSPPDNAAKRQQIIAQPMKAGCC